MNSALATLAKSAGADAQDLKVRMSEEGEEVSRFSDGSVHLRKRWSLTVGNARELNNDLRPTCRDRVIGLWY